MVSLDNFSIASALSEFLPIWFRCNQVIPLFWVLIGFFFEGPPYSQCLLRGRKYWQLRHLLKSEKLVFEKHPIQKLSDSSCFLWYCNSSKLVPFNIKQSNQLIREDKERGSHLSHHLERQSLPFSGCLFTSVYLFCRPLYQSKRRIGAIWYPGWSTRSAPSLCSSFQEVVMLEALISIAVKQSLVRLRVVGKLRML